MGGTSSFVSELADHPEKLQESLPDPELRLKHLNIYADTDILSEF